MPTAGNRVTTSKATIVLPRACLDMNTALHRPHHLHRAINSRRVVVVRILYHPTYSQATANYIMSMRHTGDSNHSLVIAAGGHSQSRSITCSVDGSFQPTSLEDSSPSHAGGDVPRR